MSSPGDTFNLDELRGNVLPRVFLARSLTTRMELRLRRAIQLATSAEQGSAEEGTHLWLNATAVTWTLVENTLKLYATIALQIDTRAQLHRTYIQFVHQRPDADTTAFSERIWLFEILAQIPDTAFTRINLDPTKSRKLLEGLAQRSTTYLRNAEDHLQAFYEKYRLAMTAYKHGRALFLFTVSITTQPDGSSDINLAASTNAATAIVAKREARLPSTFVTLTIDDEVRADVTGTLDLLAAQLPNVRAFFDTFANAAEFLLRHVEGETDVQRPVLPFSFFAAPYTAEETALLEILRHANLGF